MLVKNKGMEREGEGLKLRLLFSYFNHPMKQYAKRIGRCLNVLLEEAKIALQTFEMTKVHDIVQCTHEVNACTSRIKLKKPQGECTHRKASFFESDVKEMFPRLRRGNPEANSQKLHQALTDGNLAPRSLGVWESVNMISQLVKEAKGLRACNGAPWFGIGEERQLDVIRKAYGERAVNIPWQEVQRYVQFDIFYNDCLVLGTRVLRWHSLPKHAMYFRTSEEPEPTTYQCRVTVAFCGSFRVWPYFVRVTGVCALGTGMPEGSMPVTARHAWPSASNKLMCDSQSVRVSGMPSMYWDGLISSGQASRRSSSRGSCWSCTTHSAVACVCTGGVVEETLPSACSCGVHGSQRGRSWWSARMPMTRSSMHADSHAASQFLGTLYH